MIYRYCTALLVSIPLFLFSSDLILFDLDPIENNQYLLNNINASILDTYQYESIIFNQSHHIPYGSFIFPHLDNFSEIDTIAVKTQFILRKGDYTFRDLTIASHKINNQNIHFKYFGQVRSFDPTALPNLVGQNFLQNHMISVVKKAQNTQFSSQILYHIENPDVPISYYWDFSDITQSFYHTRESRSILWGVKINHEINKHIKISYLHSNHFSNLSQYKIDANNSASSDRYLDHIYYTGFNNLNFIYNYNKISLFSSFRINEHELTIMPDQSNQIQDLNLEIGFKLNFNRSSIKLSVLGKKMNIDTHMEENKYYLTTPSFIFLFKLNDKSTISYTLNYLDGIYDDRIYTKLNNEEYNYSRGILNYRNQELYYKGSMKKQSIQFGVGIVDHVFLYNVYDKNEYEDFYNYVNASYEYLNKYIKFRLESRKYLNFNKESTQHSTWLDSYFNYSFKLQYPFNNKPYTIFAEARGKLLSIRNGGIFVNEFPLICNDSSIRCPFNEHKLLSRNFIDMLLGIEFKDFIISYHTITNNGDNFSLNYPYSDIGTNFELPEYDFASKSYSLFHYLRISWTFLD